MIDTDTDTDGGRRVSVPVIDMPACDCLQAAFDLHIYTRI